MNKPLTIDEAAPIFGAGYAQPLLERRAWQMLFQRGRNAWGESRYDNGDDATHRGTPCRTLRITSPMPGRPLLPELAESMYDLLTTRWQLAVLGMEFSAEEITISVEKNAFDATLGTRLGLFGPGELSWAQEHAR